ncbi:gamma-glutamylcyclotransferase [Rhizobium miluonense]|uniref:glutathione-specific gamma-glutamylcyclotransferase n=1 Tax=Rhizobium miluonense TaxID=411945 RepID=A0A1C3WT87_9HYPH|nr:gamma-glutamylcyclotransferase [Rhizobium miluonense]SCB42954.1 cation transport protein ChaC [Rhizobium miluonense]
MIEDDGVKGVVDQSRMDLTDELVALSLRNEIDPGPDPQHIPITEVELDELALRLHEESQGDALWVFAYGSLIWKPDFDAVEARVAAVKGWHRSFCLRMTRWRGSLTQPGLMLALKRGGYCKGVAFRLDDSDRLGQIKRMLRREIGTIEAAATIRWARAQTDQGPVRALVFWADPKGSYVTSKLPLETVAGILARACGPRGSCAEYLYLTVKHLEAWGIRDLNLWRLQKLVAGELRAIHASEGVAGG